MKKVDLVDETINPGPARGLAGLLSLGPADIDPSTIDDGWPLPPLWHWVYFLSRPAQTDLGRDGHPLHGIPAPPGPGLRRMFAGGRVTTVRPLVIGATANSTARVINTVKRAGRAGPHTLVTVERLCHQAGQLCVREEQDIIYLSDPPRTPARDATADAMRIATTDPARANVAASTSSDRLERAFEIDRVVLFRFSALTYNAHRIHYDSDYVRTTEGYPELVVHGPLQALLMSEWARHNDVGPIDGSVKTITYRLVSPLILGEGLLVGCEATGGGIATTIRDARGRVTAHGTVQSADLVG